MSRGWVRARRGAEVVPALATVKMSDDNVQSRSTPSKDIEDIVAELAKIESGVSLAAIDVDHNARMAASLAEEEGGSPVENGCDDGPRGTHYLARQQRRHANDLQEMADQTRRPVQAALRRMTAAAAPTTDTR
jgi:hypothetical protein